MNDEDLVRLALTGDQDAYTQLYGRLQLCLRWAVHRYMFRSSREEQDEALHDVISRVFEKLDKFGFESTFVTWAGSIAKYALLDKIRRDKVAGTVFNGRLVELIDGVDVAERRIPGAYSDAVADLDSILGQLSPCHRRAVVSRHLLGLSEKEYAAANGITLGSAKVQICKGMNRARKIAQEVTA